MNIEHRVREIYERHPYPPPNLRGKATWSLPAVEWIDALRESPEPLDIKRILVAGCGVGIEAFAVAEQFPRAEVVAVDFSARSIETAGKLLRKSKVRDRVRFRVADLMDANLIATTGDDFDLITCHGVLSYIPDPAAVFRNFARLLSADGVLVLGLNGAAHPSVRFRRMLPAFGIATEKFEEDERLRDVLRIFDCLITFPRLPMADREPGYLAGDIFGPLNLAISLSDWTALFDSARLNLLGSYYAYYASRDLFNHDLHLRLMPRSRREVSEITDALQTASFHQLVVSRRAPAAIPWSDSRELSNWRPMRTRLYTMTWPQNGGPAHNLRTVTLKSAATNTKVDLRVPQWEVEIIRRADGVRSIRELLAPMRARVAPKALAEAMYLLYLLCAVNLLPPQK
jgi:SAM-dependent methyltransferase